MDGGMDLLLYYAILLKKKFKNVLERDAACCLYP